MCPGLDWQGIQAVESGAECFLYLRKYANVPNEGVKSRSTQGFQEAAPNRRV